MLKRLQNHLLGLILALVMAMRMHEIRTEEPGNPGSCGLEFQ